MPRTADDSWDIATSVGATAVMVALARAAETASDDPLIRDQFAEPLVSTPELDGSRASRWPRGGRGARRRRRGLRRRLPADDQLPGGAHPLLRRVLRRRGRRRRYPAGRDPGGRSGFARLPAGLAGRHRRVRDRPAQGAGVQGRDAGRATAPTPIADRRAVPVDLRHDWPQALRDAGFDAARPTAWLAEGLLPFLPAAAQEAMFASIDQLSGPGSRVAVEIFGVDEEKRQEAEEKWAAAAGQARSARRRHLVQPVRPLVRRRGPPRAGRLVRRARLDHRVGECARRSGAAGPDAAVGRRGRS